MRIWAIVLAFWGVATAACAEGRVTLNGRFIQGGMVIGQAEVGAEVNLDDLPVMVGEDGRFAFGFGRDYPEEAVLSVLFTDGEVETWPISVEQRDYRVQRIDGLPDSKVTPRTEEEIAHIQRDLELKRIAREATHTGTWYADAFVWPVEGIISGVYGSQRILNGEPRRPHSGVDVAAPDGTPIVAPAGGVVMLAQEDMYFEGGCIFLDHGHGMVSQFLHLSKLDVEVGDRVEQGQLIGEVGSTGRSTGPHLHWSVRWAGQMLDPEYLVPAMPAQE